MSQIKSKERVRDLAEVYTNEREVNAMLDLIPIKNPDDIISYRYLEPACGNGNFLIEILRRKMHRVNEKYANDRLSIYEYFISRAVSTIYGIDICEQNVKESRERLFRYVKSTFDLHKGSYIYNPGFFELITYILETNIVVGDSINRADEIFFTNFKASRGKYFAQETFCYADLVYPMPLPIKTEEPKHYLLIGLERMKETGESVERNQRHFDFV
jgi:hypothetical protein